MERKRKQQNDDSALQADSVKKSKLTEPSDGNKQSQSQFKASSSIKDRLADVKKRLAERKQQSSQLKDSTADLGRGDSHQTILNVPIHPTIAGTAAPSKKDESGSKQTATSQQKNPYLTKNGPKDQRLNAKLKFIRRGKLSKKADQVRQTLQLEMVKNQSELERLQSHSQDFELDLVGDDAYDQVPSLTGFDTVAVSEDLESDQYVEWWDSQILSFPRYDLESIRADQITSLIQHPVQLRPFRDDEFGSDSAQIQKIHLTRKEMRKARRLRRIEAEKERQLKVQLGLLPPVPQKLKMSSVMRLNAAGHLFVQGEPTAIELQVMQQVKERLEKHQRMNEERKLTQDQRRLKLVYKNSDDTNHGAVINVFVIFKDLSLHPKSRFKIKASAQDYHLSGLCLQCDGYALLVVEGGQRTLSKYRHVILNRLNWNIDQSLKDSDQTNTRKAEVNGLDESTAQSTLMLFEGEVAHPQFDRFQMLECYLPSEVKSHLGEYYRHFWTLSQNIKYISQHQIE
ncbi:hypothetical protein MP228_008825 [Amoeboaphelidium protococcarum]|nr:hypothetical protein MP228_008825 [Amoeboaphelidium protococcarum]